MFRSVLVANRGEIACRIVRTARRLGMRTIAVYSEADRAALHVRECDEAHLIGPAPAAKSYLAIEAIIDVARRAGAECIHPGYGFLAENADFAEACAAAGIVFVGPPPAAIRAMGLKDRAKALMEKAGVPVVPGYHGERQDPAFLKQKAYELGYPVLIKARAGGGGRGMRRVDKHADFDAALEAAQREAASAFGDARVLVEKLIAAPRHIEFQVFADVHGRTIHLNERDCSLQRRHQKVIEEAPAPGMGAALRERMGAAAVRAAAAVGYAGAGTVEFIVAGDGALRENGFWFMEMNTRLQVEHPVTEAVTGLDLVEWQFRVAAGEPLPLTQEEVKIDGHAVEARVYAEDPARGFLPTSGRLLALHLPQGEGIRVDAGVEAGSEIGSHYDAMIAKVVAHAPTREAALDRLAAALRRTVAAGPHTNLALLAALIDAPKFRAGEVETGFIESHLAALGFDARHLDRAAVAFGAKRLMEREIVRIAQALGRVPDEPASPWDATDGFQFAGPRVETFPVLADGVRVDATVKYGPAGPAVTVDDMDAALDAVAVEAADGIHVLRDGRQTVVRRFEAFAAVDPEEGDGVIRAPMHGRLLAVAVAEGDRVRKGQRLAVIEAMKMEHALAAPLSGIVTRLSATVGSQVAEGAALMVIEAE